MAQKTRPQAESLYGLPQPLQTGLYPPVIAKRDPTSSDTGYPLGIEWVNKVSANTWFLAQVSAGSATWNAISAGTQVLPVSNGGTGDSTLTAHGVMIGEGTSPVNITAAGTNGQVLIGSTGADPAFATLTSTTGVTFTGGAHSLAINVTSGGFAPNSVTGATATGAVQNSYICSDSAQTTISLPTTAVIGSMMILAGTSANSGGWVVSQASGQTIRNGTNHSTTGTGGSISTGAANTAAWLMCVVANTDWIVLNSVGTVTYT